MWMGVLIWCSLQSPVLAPAEQHAPQQTTTPVDLGYTHEHHTRDCQALPPLPSPLTLDPALLLTAQDYQSLTQYALTREQQVQEALQASIAANPELSPSWPKTPAVISTPSRAEQTSSSCSNSKVW